jgi:C1A family cysteine protease
MRKIKRYGWRRQIPDFRDRKFGLSKYFKAELAPPDVADLRPKMPAIYDQGQSGTCTGNGIARCIQFLMPAFMPSRLFIYYNEEMLEGDPYEDNGGQIRDGIKAVAQLGVCSEAEWSFDLDIHLCVKPSRQCYIDAKKDIITEYLSLNSPDEVKQAIASGFPVVFGMSVYDSFESNAAIETGIIPMPGPGESIIGGHCMVISGYDLTGKALTSKGKPVGFPCYFVDNSWGVSVDDAGRCYLPIEMIDNPDIASDFWIIQKDAAEIIAQ